MRPQPLNPSAFDPRNFCELLLADYEPCGRLQFHRGEGPFPLVADAPRLRHALENLLSNALKYSDGPVVVSLTRAAQGYRIEVSDRGIGIPVEDQAGIFEPFFRASNTGAKAGHGLGLCVVQSCIEEQGGRISFVSEPNQGTTFSIDLPSSPPGRAATQGEAVPAPIPAGKLPEPDCKLIMGNDSSVPLARAASGVLGRPGRPKAPSPLRSAGALPKTTLSTALPRSVGNSRFGLDWGFAFRRRGAGSSAGARLRRVRTCPRADGTSLCAGSR